jgi:hypothetical protein
MALLKSSYAEILESLTSLEALLRTGGLRDGELTRLQSHRSSVARIEEARLAGNLDGIDRDQTLWSLIESTEFADIYRGMSTYDPRLLAEKFKLILKGPDHPRNESDATNLARNTAFELNVAARLRSRGFDISLHHNPDILCKLQDVEVLLQCKRPFSIQNIPRNITRAADQLTRDLDVAADRNTRGVIALSVSRTVNTGERVYRASSWEAVADGLMKETRTLVEPYPWKLIKDQRVIGSVFHIITPSVIEDLGNLLSAAQQLTVYPAPQSSESDRRILRSLFMEA